MAATITFDNTRFAGGPSRRCTIVQDVSTGHDVLTTSVSTILDQFAEGLISNRALMVQWTGDQTLDLLLQYDLGSGGNGFQTVVDIHFVAGNVTPQTAGFYAGIGTTAASGTILISGTAPSFGTPPTIGSWEILKMPCDRLRIAAKAGGTTTVGTLTIDLNESP